VDLPGHRLERFKIVLSIDRHPKQPVTAMDMTGGQQQWRRGQRGKVVAVGASDAFDDGANA
jgi:hypothetical protein